MTRRIGASPESYPVSSCSSVQQESKARQQEHDPGLLRVSFLPRLTFARFKPLLYLFLKFLKWTCSLAYTIRPPTHTQQPLRQPLGLIRSGIQGKCIIAEHLMSPYCLLLLFCLLPC
jgi:hypothetical protein